MKECPCVGVALSTGGWGGSSGVRDNKKNPIQTKDLLQLQFCQDWNTRVICFKFVLPLHQIYYPE